MATIRLKRGHVQPVWAGHPWVYAQAVERVEGGATPGDEVRVVDPRGTFLGRGFYSPKSAIVVRLLVRDETTPIDAGLFEARIQHAANWRRALGLGTDANTGYRVINAEGDDLPGLVVDRYGDTAVVQFLTFGMSTRSGTLMHLLEHTLGVRTIIDRTPESIAKREGFVPNAGVVRGDAIDELSFTERGFRYRIPLDLTQKTGFYFDQRELRDQIEALAKGRDVVDAFSYVGGISLAALRGGAKSVKTIDENARALEVGAELVQHNGLPGPIEFVRSDAGKALTEIARKGGADLVVVDPPRLAPSRGALERAKTAYARLAEQGCRATRKGGTFVMCSCSSAMGLDTLTRLVATGASRANARVIIFRRMFQGPDHPVSAAVSEGTYLKVVFGRVEPR